MWLIFDVRHSCGISTSACMRKHKVSVVRARIRDRSNVASPLPKRGPLHGRAVSRDSHWRFIAAAMISSIGFPASRSSFVFCTLRFSRFARITCSGVFPADDALYFSTIPKGRTRRQSQRRDCHASCLGSDFRMNKAIGVLDRCTRRAIPVVAHL